MTELTQRHEIVFLYDVKDANPNGDPDDGNRPRTDHLGYNIVTDVRLKRTIRDYWLHYHKGKEGMGVLVQRLENKDGTVMKMGDLITNALGLPENIKDKSVEIVKSIRSRIPKRYIDVRMFGAAVTLKGANVSITGPVQFAIGKSLNKPRINTYTITTTFAAGDDKKSGTFGETHVVDYSLLCFGGIISEMTANETGLNEEDLIHLWEGLWKGTKSLNTRSKFNHLPRVLLSIVSKGTQFQIGGMYRKLKLQDSEQSEKVGAVNSESEVEIDTSAFLERLEKYKDSIEKIMVLEDNTLHFTDGNSSTTSIEELLSSKGFTTEKIQFRE